MSRERCLLHRLQRSTVTNLPRLTSNCCCFSTIHLWWLLSHSTLRLLAVFFVNFSILLIESSMRQAVITVGSVLWHCVGFETLWATG